MAVTPSTMLPLGTTAHNFSLLDTTSGRPVARSHAAGRPLLVIFLCNHCPFVIHLRPHLAVTTRAWIGRGLVVVGISSNDAAAYPADAPERMREEAAAHGYAFPYLYDADQSVAKAYRAACTPDFFLFDGSHRLAYRGRYDDTRPTRHGVTGSPPTGSELSAAVEAVLAGQLVAGEQKPSMGCNIKWIPGNEPPWFT